MTVRGSPQRHRWVGDVPGSAATHSQVDLSSHGDRTLVTIKQECCAPRHLATRNGRLHHEHHGDNHAVGSAAHARAATR